MTTQTETANAILEPTSEPQMLLGGNRRLLAVNLLLGIVALLLGIGLVSLGGNLFLRVLGVILSLVALPAIWFAWRFHSQPRLAITSHELLVYVRPNYREPYRVPLDVVEVFFIGQGAVSGTEPGQPKDYEGAVAANVIVRLAESAKDWHHRDVHLLLGVWNDGYITVRGLLCDNIDQEVLKTMNKRLLGRKRELRGEQA